MQTDGWLQPYQPWDGTELRPCWVFYVYGFALRLRLTRVKEIGAGCDASFSGNFISQHIRLAPLRVTVRNHHVEAGLAALFCCFDQPLITQVLQVLFNP